MDIKIRGFMSTNHFCDGSLKFHGMSGVHLFKPKLCTSGSEIAETLSKIHGGWGGGRGGGREP